MRTYLIEEVARVLVGACLVVGLLLYADSAKTVDSCVRAADDVPAVRPVQ